MRLDKGRIESGTELETILKDRIKLVKHWTNGGDVEILNKSGKWVLQNNPSLIDLRKTYRKK